MPWRGPQEPDEVPTLGFLVGEWIEEHCVIPDQQHRGSPYRLTDEMWTFLAQHYRLRPDAVEHAPASAWVHRRSQLIRPQKWGKGPLSAAMVCAEAVGPTFFGGWDADGEPVGVPWATPLIQITAASEDQTDNIWRALVPMIELGPLADVITDTGETRINLPNGGRIDPVTSKARSRLGAPITLAVQDEVGTWTKSNGGQLLAETQRRGLAGMGGRSIETSNAWDLAENSVAQQTATSASRDLYRDLRLPPAHLKYAVHAQRQRIHRYVYGDCWWVDMDRIEAEAAELIDKGEALQAERFFGNRPVSAGGAWLPDGAWSSGDVDELQVPEGSEVCGGFDGSDSDDWTAIRLETFDGYRFTPTYGPDARPATWNPADWDGRIPRSEVHAAWDELARRYKLVRVFCDPRDWQTEIGDWSLRFGDEVFLEWATYRTVQMHEALRRLVVDLGSGRTTHSREDEVAAQHVANARKMAQRGDRYILAKPNQHQKIDVAMADVLAHEAAAQAREAGWTGRRRALSVPRRIR